MSIYSNLPVRQRTVAYAVTVPGIIVAWALLVAWLVDIIAPTVLAAVAMYAVFRGHGALVPWEQHAARVAALLLILATGGRLLHGWLTVALLVIAVILAWVSFPVKDGKDSVKGVQL